MGRPPRRAPLARSKKARAEKEDKQAGGAESPVPTNFMPSGAAKVTNFRLSVDQEQRIEDIVGFDRSKNPEFFAALDFAVVGQSQSELDKVSAVGDIRKDLRHLYESCGQLQSRLSSLKGQALYLVMDALPDGGTEFEAIQSILGDLEYAVQSAQKIALRYGNKQPNSTRRLLADSVRDAMLHHTTLKPTDYTSGPFAKILQVLLYPNEKNSQHDLGRVLGASLRHSDKNC